VKPKETTKRDFGCQMTIDLDSENEAANQQSGLLVKMPKSPTMNGKQTFENTPRTHIGQEGSEFRMH
jgi:hypothetical protein